MLRVYTQTNLSPLEIQNFDVNDIVLFTLLTLHHGTLGTRVRFINTHHANENASFSVPSVGSLAGF